MLHLPLTIYTDREHHDKEPHRQHTTAHVPVNPDNVFETSSYRSPFQQVRVNKDAPLAESAALTNDEGPAYGTPHGITNVLLGEEPVYTREQAAANTAQSRHSGVHGTVYGQGAPLAPGSQAMEADNPFKPTRNIG